jgi:hypothetical protein
MERATDHEAAEQARQFIDGMNIEFGSRSG